MKKYWTVILSEWRNRGRDGLTLPFVIGSQKYLGQSIRQDIKELFADILISDAKLYLKYCLTTEEIILGIYDEKKGLVGQFPKYNGQNQSQLFVTEFLDLGDNVTDMVQSLTEKYQFHIDRQELSKKTDRTWGDFDGDDINFIKTSFKQNGLRE